MNSNRNLDDNRLNVNGNNWNDNNNGYAFEWLKLPRTKMKTHNDLYERIASMPNLILAWRKARKGKTKKLYIVEFEKNTRENLLALRSELLAENYNPRSMKTFILRDPKTRKISKSDFRDRIIHHAIVNILEPIFDKTFIEDSCANRKGKGNLYALKRFYKFIRKVSRNGKVKGEFNKNQIKGYCLKADIKHYFQEVDRGILLEIIARKVKDEKTLWLIDRILQSPDCANFGERERETHAKYWNASRQFDFTIFREHLSK